MDLASYHAQGRHKDPREAVLSASMLIRGFHGANHPDATLQAIVGEPFAPTFYTLSGTFLHMMLLEGLEPVRQAPYDFTYAAKGGPKRFTIGETWWFGDWMIPPKNIAPANHNEGKGQRAELAVSSKSADLKLLDEPSLSDVYRAFAEAREAAEWLRGRVVEMEPIVTDPGSLCGLCDSTAGCAHPRTRCEKCSAAGLAENMEGHDCHSVSAQHARYLLTEAPGDVEQSYFGEWCGIKVRARPDKVLSEDGGLLNLKRTYKAAPSQFWKEADRAGWWVAEAFYEMVMDEGRAEKIPEWPGRPWVICAIAPRTKTEPPQAYTYPCPENRQHEARRLLAEYLGRHKACLDTGRWERFEETLAEQPSPGGLYDWRVDYDMIEHAGAEESVPWEGDEE